VSARNKHKKPPGSPNEKKLTISWPGEFTFPMKTPRSVKRDTRNPPFPPQNQGTQQPTTAKNPTVHLKKRVENHTPNSWQIPKNKGTGRAKDRNGGGKAGKKKRRGGNTPPKSKFFGKGTR